MFPHDFQLAVDDLTEVQSTVDYSIDSTHSTVRITCICMYVCIHVCACVCASIYVCVCVHMHMHTCHAHMYTLCVRACVCVYMYMHVICPLAQDHFISYATTSTRSPFLKPQVETKILIA